MRSELGPVEAASRLSLAELQARHRDWQHDLDKVDSEIIAAERARPEHPDEGRYAEALTFFYNRASELHDVRSARALALPRARLSSPRAAQPGAAHGGRPTDRAREPERVPRRCAAQEFKMDLDRLEQRTVALARLFGEDPSQTEPHSILATLSMFLRRLEKAADDVRRRRETAGRAAAATAATGRPLASGSSGSACGPMSAHPPSPTVLGGSFTRRQSAKSRPSLSLVSAIDSISVERPTMQRGHSNFR